MGLDDLVRDEEEKREENSNSQIEDSVPIEEDSQALFDLKQ